VNHSDATEFGPNSPERLITELVAMRDAVVRLSLALEDYCFYVKSKQHPDLALEVEALLVKIKTVSMK
jgi:hypothetical protein